MGKPSGGYSHSAGGFLHGNYDPPMSFGDAGERLTGKRVCICVGAGGVGKTSISAALAVGLAARRPVTLAVKP